MSEDLYTVGQPVPRVGLAEKIRGETRYTADLKRPGMLYGAVLRSPHAHARITAIDTAAAEAMPGVHAVITYRDVSDARIDPDLPVLDTVVRFVGDEVAAVAADSPHSARDALERIQVTYSPLPAVFEADEALRPGAPLVHPEGNLLGGEPLVVQRGDTAVGFAQAARTYEGEFRTQSHGPVGMETRAALAEWDGDAVTVWKTSRSLYMHDQPNLARVLGLEPEQVRVICTAMGGGFGNKDEGRLAALTALLARKAGHPVRMEYGRAEEFIAGRNRQSTTNHLRIGLAEDGSPLAIELHSVMNAGAHIATGRNVTRRIGQGPIYLYRCPNARYEGHTVYTNRPAGGSFRGLGAPLGHFALEVLIDQIAADLGIDPLEYRLRHHVPLEGQPGERTTPPDQLLPDEPVEGGVPFASNGLRACLLAGGERIGWKERRQPNGDARRAPPGARLQGMGVAMGIYKGGIGREAGAELRVAPDGRITLAVGIVDVGQGSETVLAQIAGEVLQQPPGRVNLIMADTARTPRGHIAAGSSTTFSTGSAVKQAAESVRNRLLEHAANALGATDAVLEGGVFRAKGAAGASSGSPAEGLTLDQVVATLGEEIVGHAAIIPGSADYLVNAFSAHFAEVEVEPDSGRIRVLRYVAAQDSGRIVNPLLAESQVSSAVLQFLGIALREELLLDARSGVTLNPSFLEHKSPAIVDYPPIEVIFAGEPDPIAPFGAKGLGEPPVVPVLAAIANAVANATGVWLHEAPFTPARLLAALNRHREGAA